MKSYRYQYEYNEFEDGNDPAIRKAIAHANRLKLIRNAEILDLYEDCEKPYYAHLYWQILHNYDMYEEYLVEDMDWIESMSDANWKSVKEYIDTYKVLFVQSAKAHDNRSDTNEKFGYADTKKVCSMNELKSMVGM